MSKEISPLVTLENWQVRIGYIDLDFHLKGPLNFVRWWPRGQKKSSVEINVQGVILPSTPILSPWCLYTAS